MDEEFDDFVTFRSRVATRLFMKLEESKATAADQISATILKRLADCLGVPFALVVRRLFYAGCWPQVWKFHLIVPVFKKGSAFQPSNYFGVHLTTMLTKIAEKMVGVTLVPMLQKRAFGKNQWTFTPGLSARDLASMLMMSWILTMCHYKKISCFLNHISGASDRVFKPYLLAKLQYFGVGALFSNLSPRTGQAVVQGQRSCNMKLSNSVSQGTVNGPTLWNAFFSDVSLPAASMGGQEAMLADDLNVFKESINMCRLSR